MIYSLALESDGGKKRQSSFPDCENMGIREVEKENLFRRFIILWGDRFFSCLAVRSHSAMSIDLRARNGEDENNV